MRYSDPLNNPWYYLDNFEIVLDWVRQRYHDLLLPEEADFIRQFMRTPRPARALLVRMIMRKGDVFRADKLRYPEIGCPLAALAALADTAWVDANPALTVDELFGLLLRSELGQLLAPLLANTGVAGATKAAQRQALLALNLEPRRLLQWAESAGKQPVVDPIYRLNIRALCDRLRLMFFGNLHQDWTEFVLADLGTHTYEAVSLDASSRAFQQREQIDAYLHLHQCRQELDEATDADALNTLLACIPTEPYPNDWLEERRSKLLFRLGRHAERQQQWSVAESCYQRSAYREARTRRIRVLERNQQYTAAHELAQLALTDTTNDAEQQAVLRMMPRLQRLCGYASKKTANCPGIVRIDVTLPAPAQTTRIEEEVRQHLAQDAAPAFYVENALFNSLFGLLCWDTLFASVPGAFFHPFQHGPADLLHADFRKRRQSLFAEHFDQLHTGQYQETIRCNFERKAGVLSPFVYWGALPEQLLDLALDCIPAAHLKAAFERLLNDIRGNRSGLPDLIQFWPDERRYRLIEVKGPGDRLQDNQLRWLDHFNRHGVPVSVCYVQRPVPS
ncbi:MAG: VRR-NUC domain-containing protein [Candidimonas sp.]|nr:VRR-NUC domain-containing protein [Candidimonas sp.]